MDVTKTAENLATRMAEQLRVRGTGLEDVAAKAGRRLPKHLQAEVRAVIEAAHMAEHPKLARKVDEKRVRTAVRRVEKFLARQNPSAERRGEILDRIAAIAFVLFTITVVLFFVLLSRGAFD